MAFFKTRAKTDPEGVHRSIWTLYVVKHKDKELGDENKAYEVAKDGQAYGEVPVSREEPRDRRRGT